MISKLKATGVVAAGVFCLVAANSPGWLESGRQEDWYVRTLEGHKGWVRSIAFSPDGKVLATGAWEDGDIRLWDPGSGMLKSRLTAKKQSINCLTISVDGTKLASTGETGVVLWKLVSGELLHTIPSDGVEASAFSPDGKVLATGGHDAVLRLWDVQTAKLVRELKCELGISGIAFSADGTTLASAGRHSVVTDHTKIVGEIRLWDTSTGELKRTILGREAVMCVLFSPDGKLVAGGRGDGTVRFWNREDGRPSHTIRHGAPGEVSSIAFSPDGKMLASAYYDLVYLWDARSGKLIHKLCGHHGHHVSAVAFSPDGKILASGGADKNVTLWELAKVLNQPQKKDYGSFHKFCNTDLAENR